MLVKPSLDQFSIFWIQLIMIHILIPGHFFNIGHSPYSLFFNQRTTTPQFKLDLYSFFVRSVSVSVSDYVSVRKLKSVNVNAPLPSL
jgi:hypothetical protein